MNRAEMAFGRRCGFASGRLLGARFSIAAPIRRYILIRQPIAARLQGIAEPNTVVIAESTRRLLGNLFELQDLGAKDLKGVVEPLHTWAVLRPSAVESRFEALRTGTTPLVGRDEEIDLLMRRWTQAKAGDGRVVLISGEPGIGRDYSPLHWQVS
jgi:hypothetical protein